METCNYNLPIVYSLRLWKFKRSLLSCVFRSDCWRYDFSIVGDWKLSRGIRHHWGISYAFHQWWRFPKPPVAPHSRFFISSCLSSILVHLDHCFFYFVSLCHSKEVFWWRIAIGFYDAKDLISDDQMRWNRIWVPNNSCHRNV